MKRDNVDRHAVPEDRLERFMGLIYSLVEPFGIDQVPEVHHYVELLGQAIERHIVESKFSGSSQHRMTADRRKFIAIFKNRYVHTTDMEYGRAITGIDGKMIGQVVKILEEKNFEVDEYLTWLFDDFLAENPKFCPPTIKFACGNLVLEKFLYVHREQIKQKREETLRRKMSSDLTARARVLIRTFANDENTKKKITDMLKDYLAGSIMLDKMRVDIETLERVARESTPSQPAQEAQQAGEDHGTV